MKIKEFFDINLEIKLNLITLKQLEFKKLYYRLYLNYFKNFDFLKIKFYSNI